MSRFIDERKADLGVEPICRILGVSASAYYERAGGPPSARTVRDRELLAVIDRVHQENYEAYGYRRTWLELGRRGVSAPRCQVQRLMRAQGIVGAKRRGKPWKTTVADAEAQRRPDLLQRDFTAAGPNQRWVADFTYLRSWEGVAFFAFILDVYSRYLVGWQFATHMRDTLVIDALQMAASTRRVDPTLRLVHHSDRGSQYSSADFAWALADYDILASVGSVGDAYDNAMAESFVDTLKTELIADRVWRTHAALELGLAGYVGWYNQLRIHSSIGDRPPAEYEALHARASAGAPNCATPSPTFSHSPGSADLEETALRAAPRARGDATQKKKQKGRSTQSRIEHQENYAPTADAHEGPITSK